MLGRDQAFDVSGNFLRDIHLPAHVSPGITRCNFAFDREGNVFLAHASRRVHVIAPSGEQITEFHAAQEERHLSYCVRAVCVDGEGRVYVRDSQRLQVFVFPHDA